MLSLFFMFFIRHGQTEFNVVYDSLGYDPGIKDAPLTPLGFYQIRKAADSLKGRGIAAILSSPYTRALQSAVTLAETLGAKVQVEPLVGERALYSCDIGSPTSVLAKGWPGIDFGAINRESWWPSKQESHNDLMSRVQAFKDKWDWVQNNTRLLVVSHWHFIHGVTGYYPNNGEIVQI